MKNVVIFCSASNTIDARYNRIAENLVRRICAAGYGVVSGGTTKGTMGVISGAVASCGGYHKGVVPTFMSELRHPALTETVWTETMAERKGEMRKDTVAAIALPGGIGTIDELVETLVLAKLHQYKGKVMALNTDGFYNPLKDMLDHFVKTNMLEQCDRDLITFPETEDELLSSL